MPRPTRGRTVAYLQALVTVALLPRPGTVAGTPLPVLAGRLVLVACLLTVAGLVVYDPGRIHRGTDPAPRWLLSLAGVGTLAALGLVASLQP